MFKLKEYLQEALGELGCALYLLIQSLLFLTPLIIIDTHFIVFLILIFVMLNVPILSSIVSLIVYIWSFIIVINGNFSLVPCILYYISLALYVITELIPNIITLLLSITEKE